MGNDFPPYHFAYHFLSDCEPRTSWKPRETVPSRTFKSTWLKGFLRRFLRIAQSIDCFIDYNTIHVHYLTLYWLIWRPLLRINQLIDLISDCPMSIDCVRWFASWLKGGNRVNLCTNWTDGRCLFTANVDVWSISYDASTIEFKVLTKLTLSKWKRQIDCMDLLTLQAKSARRKFAAWI